MLDDRKLNVIPSFANNSNISQKSDMGKYSYSSQKPNAILNFSNLSGQAHTVADNEIEYTLFNKTSFLLLWKSSTEVEVYDIFYGPDDQRRKSQAYSSETGQTITTIYSGLFEERSNGDRLYHIKSPAGISALVVTNKNDAAKRDISMSKAGQVWGTTGAKAHLLYKFNPFRVVVMCRSFSTGFTRGYCC